MKIEQQVCNLELAKKLKELGVKQDSLFYYSIGPLDDSLQIGKLDHGWSEPVENISAFTINELLEMLPEFTGRELTIKRGNNYYLVYYDKNSIGAITDNEHISDQIDESLCNALAKMLCYLKENNLTN